jgi:hypothetical protein
MCHDVNSLWWWDGAKWPTIAGAVQRQLSDPFTCRDAQDPHAIDTTPFVYICPCMMPAPGDQHTEKQNTCSSHTVLPFAVTPLFLFFSLLLSLVLSLSLLSTLARRHCFLFLAEDKDSPPNVSRLWQHPKDGRSIQSGTKSVLG